MLANVVNLFGKISNNVCFTIIRYSVQKMPRNQPVQRKILPVFQQRKEWLEKVVGDSKILTVLDFLLVELLRELFRQLKFESHPILIQPKQEHDSMFQTS